MYIAPIETHYNGYKFRSRIEARWAVFFDTLSIRYEYEKEGYNLNGTWYLPDFWLPDYGNGRWIEIKGQIPTQKEIELVRLLAQYTGKDAYIFFGNIPSHTELMYSDSAYFIPKYCQCSIYPVLWGQCPICHVLGLIFPNSGYICDCIDNIQANLHTSSDLIEAYTAARQARF